jgi:hypothetical protein
MLPSCRTRGGYQWRRTTTATDVVNINNADELYSKLPLGAVSLEGELARSGHLAVQTTVSGQLQLAEFSPEGVPRGAECEGATHVIRSLTIGAFKLRSGGAARVSAEVGVVGIGTGEASSSSGETLIREAGRPDRCELGTDLAPHAECASPIQVFLEPLPSSVVDRGPTGAVKVKFLPVRTEEKWEVVVGDRTLCTTPCERWVDPAMPYTLKYDPGFWQRNEYLEIPDLRPHAALERLEVRAQPRNASEFVGGILLTSLGGIATITGTVLTAAGCGGSKGMCEAGLITLPAGLLAVAPGIWMIVDSAGVVHITQQKEGNMQSLLSPLESTPP